MISITPDSVVATLANVESDHPIVVNIFLMKIATDIISRYNAAIVCKLHSNLTIDNEIHLIIKPIDEQRFINEYHRKYHLVQLGHNLLGMRIINDDTLPFVYVHTLHNSSQYAIEHDYALVTPYYDRFKCMTADMIATEERFKKNIPKELMEYLLHPSRVFKWIQQNKEIEDYLM